MLNAAKTAINETNDDSLNFFIEVDLPRVRLSLVIG